jgi:hypothetical protein
LDTNPQNRRSEAGNDVAGDVLARDPKSLEQRDLPEPLPLRKILGPGIIAVGVSMAAGEFILWPFVTSIVGLGLLWVAVTALAAQVFINTEIERYTLATGETAVTGFARFWKPWGLFFCLAAIFQYAWPGWATSASTVFTFALGVGEGWVVPMTIVALFLIGIALTVSPVVYQTVEKVQFFKVGATIVFLTVVIVGVISFRAWSEAPAQVVGGFGRIPAGLSIALVLAAIGAAGGGGISNLVLSNWIRDKGYGMGAHIPRLVSPVTGEEVAAPSTGYIFPQDEANLARWKVWWRRATIEHFVSFFVICLLTITIMSLLAYSTVYGQNLSEEPNTDFLRAEGEVLGQTIGGWFQYFFYAVGAISLYAAALGLLDVLGRVVSDVLKVGYLANSRYWSESKIYFVVVWAEIIIGSLILLLGLDQPIVLLVIATAAGAVVTFIYSVLLVKLNRSGLPGAIQIRGFRLVGLGGAILFYGFFSILLVITQVGNLLGGG